MDRLINYIEQRAKKYGHIKGMQGQSSNYYTIGQKIVRISDHMKYGEDGIKKYDYCFIIQPNDVYLFNISPKNVPDLKMYVKIISYDDAKNFIKKMHEFAMILDDMSEMYNPTGWNCGKLPVSEDKLSWGDFCQKYMTDLDQSKCINILDIIERVGRGQIAKGGYEVKLARNVKYYEKLTQTQYETVIASIEKMLDKTV